MPTLIQIVLAFIAAALLLIVLVVVVAIQLTSMLAGIEEEVAEHPASQTESVRH
jgi:type IV secretory pathway TrbL component